MAMFFGRLLAETANSNTIHSDSVVTFIFGGGLANLIGSTNENQISVGQK